MRKLRTFPDQAAALQLVCGSQVSEVLSAGLRKSHPKFIQMVESGVKLGANISASCASYLEHWHRSQDGMFREIRDAISYPLTVALIFWVIGVGMVVFVVPNFLNEYQDSGRELSPLTLFFANLGILGFSFYVFIAVAIVFLPVFLSFYKSMSGKLETYTAFLMTQHLVAGGVDVGKALAAMTAQSSKVDPEIMELARKGLRQGSSHEYIPKAVVQSLRAEIERCKGNFKKFIEPLMIVVIGGFIGTFVIAMYLPIFNVAGGR